MPEPPPSMAGGGSKRGGRTIGVPAASGVGNADGWSGGAGAGGIGDTAVVDLPMPQQPREAGCTTGAVRSGVGAAMAPETALGTGSVPAEAAIAGTLEVVAKASNGPCPTAWMGDAGSDVGTPDAASHRPEEGRCGKRATARVVAGRPRIVVSGGVTGKRSNGPGAAIGTNVAAVGGVATTCTPPSATATTPSADGVPSQLPVVTGVAPAARGASVALPSEVVPGGSIAGRSCLPTTAVVIAPRPPILLVLDGPAAGDVMAERVPTLADRRTLEPCDMPPSLLPPAPLVPFAGAAVGGMGAAAPPPDERRLGASRLETLKPMPPPRLASEPNSCDAVAPLDAMLGSRPTVPALPST